MINPTDITLWKEIKSGNKKAFKIMFERYADDLFRYGQKITVDVGLSQDTVQELFMTIWDDRSRFTVPRDTKSYLLRALRNNLLRKIKKESRVLSMGQEFPLVNAKSMDIETDNSEELLILRKYVSQLPNRQKEVIHLRYYQNLKNDEISEIMGISYQSVSNLLQRAIKELRPNIRLEAEK